MKENWLQTFSKGRFYPERPEITKIEIVDIALGLSNMCRFAGQIHSFYSVAQHSVFVANAVKELGGDRIQQFAGLMHDASEAYMVDIPTPMKVLLPQYKELEGFLMGKINEHFGVSTDSETTSLIKAADKIALATEADFFFGEGMEWESIDGADRKKHLLSLPVGPPTARLELMEQFDVLYGHRNTEGRMLC